MSISALGSREQQTLFICHQSLKTRTSPSQVVQWLVNNNFDDVHVLN